MTEMAKMVECRVNGRRYYRQTESIEMDAEKSILYINVVIINASEAIKDKLRSKVEESRLPKRLRRVVTATATGIAETVLTLHKIAKKVSKKSCHKLPEKMFLRGITAVVEEVFREGPYVVFKLEVQRVDMATLKEKQLKRHEKNADTVDDDDDDNSTCSKHKKDDSHTHSKKKKMEVDTKTDTDTTDTDNDTQNADTDFTSTTVDAAMTIATMQPHHVKNWLLYWLKQVLAWFL
jgi:hypothetical protein